MHRDSDGSASQRGEWILIVVASGIRLWLTAARTVEAIGWATYDDFWFLQKAQSILQGRWLGDYDHLTLIKGPGYPIAIALVSSLGVPLLFAQQVLYVLACLAVVRALLPALPSSFVRFALFVVLLFNPMSFSDEIATRVTREGVYPAMTLLLFAGVAGVVLRLDARRTAVLRWLLLTGVATAVFWHTREEGVWILPLFALALGALLRWAIADGHRRWQRTALVVSTPALIVVAAHLAILLANGRHYGTHEVVEFKEESFLRAYGSLTRVRQHPALPRVPMPRESRERVYAVSPAFAELRHFLEGVPGKGWSNNSPLQARGDFGGAVFMWAFRDAVADAGYYRRGASAAGEYYDRLSREIDAARVEGRLDARPARATLLPPLLRGQRREILRTWKDGLRRVLTFADVAVTSRTSAGRDAELRQYAELTHGRLAPRNTRIASMHLLGWVIHVDGALDIAIVGADGKPLPGAQVIRLPSPDLYEHLRNRWKEFPPARHARFDIRVPAAVGAQMVLSLRGREIERILLGYQTPVTSDAKVRMAVDAYEVGAVQPQLSSLAALDFWRLRLLSAIGRVYQLLMAPLFVLVALLYLAHVRWWWRTRDWRVVVLIAALLAAILTRVLLLSIIDVTSFWVFTAGYQSPSHALLLIACVLMAHDAMLATRARWTKRT